MSEEPLIGSQETVRGCKKHSQSGEFAEDSQMQKISEGPKGIRFVPWINVRGSLGSCSTSLFAFIPFSYIAHDFFVCLFGSAPRRFVSRDDSSRICLFGSWLRPGSCTLASDPSPLSQLLMCSFLATLFAVWSYLGLVACHYRLTSSGSTRQPSQSRRADSSDLPFAD